MAKINPRLAEDFNLLLGRVDHAGKLASDLISRGLSADDIKKGVKKRFGVGLGTWGATKIMAAVLEVW
jgi:hypothetical protein